MKVYLDTVREVLETGTRKENRTGVDTISTFNINYEIDLAHGFPSPHHEGDLLEEHRRREPVVPLRRTHIGLLKKHGCRFWDPWADEDGRVPSAYGNFWRRFPVHENGEAAFNDQVAWVLEELEAKSDARRLLVTAWAPGNAQRAGCRRAMPLRPQRAERTGRASAAQPALDAAELRRRARHPLQHRGLRPSPRALLSFHAGSARGSSPTLWSTPTSIPQKPDGSMAEYDHVPGLERATRSGSRGLFRASPSRPRFARSTTSNRSSPRTPRRCSRTSGSRATIPHPAISFKVAV